MEPQKIHKLFKKHCWKERILKVINELIEEVSTHDELIRGVKVKSRILDRMQKIMK